MTDVEKLIERLEQGIDPNDIPEAEAAMDHAAAMLRSQEHLRKALDNMTEEYHHLRDEKASLTATVNDMATMVNEARAKLERARECLEAVGGIVPHGTREEYADHLRGLARATLEEISPFPEA